MAKILHGMPDYYERLGAGAEQPLYLMLNLKTRCSMRCPKCALPGRARSRVGQALVWAEQQRLLGLAAQAGFKALVIIGAGEPTENFPMMRQVVGGACDLGLDAILFSTASHLDQAQAIFYAEHRTTIFVSLDSLDPDNYRLLTGKGDLAKTLVNIRTLRQAYAELGDAQVLRLGINTTVVQQNKHELSAIRRFAGEDMLFVANTPIRRGKFASNVAWQKYVGSDEDYEGLTRLASQASETGSHTSTIRGVCGYFSRGIALDVDGAILSCGYASETAGGMGHATDIRTADDLMAVYRTKCTRFNRFVQSMGHVPSCPLRDTGVEHFIRCMGKE